MSFWSPRRSVVFLTIWAIATPIKVIFIDFHRGVDVTVIAGLWEYLPTYNPYVMDPLLHFVWVLFMLPFYAPGLIMAGLVWHGSRDKHMTRQQYYGLVVTLLAIQILLTFIIPCPISTGSLVWCVPTPTTAFPALFLISRVVKEPMVPWSKATSKDQTFTSDTTDDLQWQGQGNMTTN